MYNRHLPPPFERIIQAIKDGFHHHYGIAKEAQLDQANTRYYLMRLINQKKIIRRKTATHQHEKRGQMPKWFYYLPKKEINK